MEHKTLAILNRSVMNDLIGNDEKLIKKFEVDFLVQGKLSVQKITKLYNSNEISQIKEEAHFLKTSAKAVGAELVASILQRLEYASESKERSACKESIIQLNEALKQVYEVVKNGN